MTKSTNVANVANVSTVSHMQLWANLPYLVSRPYLFLARLKCSFQDPSRFSVCNSSFALSPHNHDPVARSAAGSWKMC